MKAVSRHIQSARKTNSTITSSSAASFSSASDYCQQGQVPRSDLVGPCGTHPVRSTPGHPSQSSRASRLCCSPNKSGTRGGTSASSLFLGTALLSLYRSLCRRSRSACGSGAHSTAHRRSRRRSRSEMVPSRWYRRNIPCDTDQSDVHQQKKRTCR
jgi:hypothetical protein